MPQYLGNAPHEIEQKLRQRVKGWILPRAASPRRLPVGIGRGLRMTIDFQAGQTGLYFGLYEIELNRHLQALCRPGYRSFDVGGSVGYDALVIAKLTGADVTSLECDSELCDKLAANVALNPRLSSLISVRQAFVCGQTVEPGRHVALDDLASLSFVPDFIKMDIEGGEAEALQGAAKILSTRKPNLLIEVHGREQEEKCLAALRNHSYSPTVVDRRKWIPDYRPIEHNRWLIAAGANRP